MSDPPWPVIEIFRIISGEISERIAQNIKAEIMRGRR